MPKSNKSFSSKDHVVHIGKAGSRLSLAQQVILNLPLRHLTKSEMTWLKNRIHDHRPEAKSWVGMAYVERFYCLVRNQKKQELSIQTLTLSINGEI